MISYLLIKNIVETLENEQRWVTNMNTKSLLKFFANQRQ